MKCKKYVPKDFEETFMCAQVFSCALVSWPVRARAVRTQLRANIDRKGQSYDQLEVTWKVGKKDPELNAKGNSKLA